MTEYPQFGTRPIRCGTRGCGWSGLETDLVPGPRKGISFANLCPSCGLAGYYFMTDRQIANRDKRRAAASVGTQGEALR